MAYNIIFYFSDQQRWDTCGCFGQPLNITPNLDKLAAEFLLDKAGYEELLDLAARSRDQRVSADLPEYIMERDIVRAALRTAKEVDATDEEWQEFIDRLTKRKEV